MSITAGTNAWNPWRADVTPGIVLVGRLALGVLFIYAASTKVFHIDEFAVEVREYGILPNGLVSLFATLLPWAEMVFGSFLIVGLFTRFSAVMLGLMLVSFIVAIGYNIAIGNDIGSCGCFGTSDPSAAQETMIEVLFRDLLWMVAAIVVIASRRHVLTLDSVIACRPTPERK